MLFAPHAVAAEPKWKPADGPLMTRWAKEVSPEKVHAEYPRPQMVRKDWRNLNGLWDYAICPKDAKTPDKWDGKIMVPFPAESALSGVMKRVGPDKRLWYRRSFEVPAAWTKDGKRVLLHFEAVDWHAVVTVNGKAVGEHRGGYDPFTLDVTGALKSSGEQEIIVSVWDPTDGGYQPRGKQVRKNRGIWYTPVTGIWQTVWLEPVPKAYIRSLKIVPDVDKNVVRVTADVPGATEKHRILLQDTILGKKVLRSVTGKAGQELTVTIDKPRLWSPDSPHLYELEVLLLGNAEKSAPVDMVKTYFGMRKIAVAKDASGVNRLFLNGKALFQYGPLDQGWWPDGLYTAPTDEALRYDVEVLKKIGCNMIRKHVKIEPRRWYYHCDKLGMLVWQDMPNGNNRGDQGRKNFRRELRSMIDTHRNAPSIVMWVPFNEGWGQHDSPEIVKWMKGYDPTRLVNHASGWKDRGAGDVKDVHKYPGPRTAALEEKRAVVLGEFGGLGLPVKGHLWWNKKNWGYRNYKTKDELAAAYSNLISRLHPLIGKGLAAAVYTQTTDVEGEVNGLMTYDRAMVKMGEELAARLNRRLYLPPPVIKTIVPTSEKKKQSWRYTTDKPADGWEKPDFDDSKWKTGPGGFGKGGTPGTVVGTEWTTPDIWIRRTFELKAKPAKPQLRIYHDEDAEVYINGKLAAKVPAFTAGYVTVPVSKQAAAALKLGANTLAVHCKQTTGGQGIDVGIVEEVETDKSKSDSGRGKTEEK